MADLVRLERGIRVSLTEHESLVDATLFISTIEKRQGLKVSCPEEIAWRNHWIDDAALEKLAQPLAKSGYGLHLLDLLREKVY